MAQNFSLGQGGPLQPKGGIVSKRFAPTVTSNKQLQDILRWLESYKGRPNFLLGESGDLIPKYSTGKNKLVPYQPDPNFKLGKGGPLRTPTNPKNIIPLLEDKLGRIPLLESNLGKKLSRQIELDKLYSNGTKIEDFVKGLDSSFKGKAKKTVAKAIVKSDLPLTLGAGAVTAFSGAQDVKKYLKNFSDYARVSLKNTGKSIYDVDSKELNRIKRDFNSLYFKNPANLGTTSKALQAIVSLPAFGTAPGYKGLEKFVSNLVGDTSRYTEPSGMTKPPTEPLKEEPKKTVVANKPNFYDFDPATGLPILPGEAIGWDGGGEVLTQPPSQNQAVGYTQPVQQGQQAQQQTKQAGRTVEDIIALAQAQQQLRNEQMAPYVEALQEAMEKYGANRENNFKRDLSLASLSGMTKNPAYASMIGRYDENQPLEKRLALQQQLAGLKQQQLFDPTPIYGNAELVQRMGLAPEAALANTDFLKQYANIYNYGLDYNAVLARLKQQEQQNALNRQLEWNIHMNPQYNTLASQAQLGSSLLSNMQISPALRESMTPEMIQYLISLTGYKPGSTPVPVQKPGQKPSEDDIIDYNASLRGR